MRQRPRVPHRRPSRNALPTTSTRNPASGPTSNIWANGGPPSKRSLTLSSATCWCRTSTRHTSWRSSSRSGRRRRRPRFASVAASNPSSIGQRSAATVPGSIRTLEGSPVGEAGRRRAKLRMQSITRRCPMLRCRDSWRGYVPSTARARMRARPPSEVDDPIFPSEEAYSRGDLFEQRVRAMRAWAEFLHQPARATSVTPIRKAGARR